MFFRIQESIDRKKVGRYPQVTEGIYHTNINDPYFIGNSEYEFIEHDVSVPGIKLESGAKRTDLIGAGIIGISARKVISSKLKSLIQNHRQEGFQYFKTYVIDHNDHFGDYWILHPYQFNYEILDFEKSTVWIEGMGGEKLRRLETRSKEDFFG
jgi:hypothetical protein